MNKGTNSTTSKRPFPTLYDEVVEDRLPDGAFKTYSFNPDMVADREKDRSEIVHRNSASARELYRSEIMLLKYQKGKCDHCKTEYSDLTNYRWGCRFHPGRLNRKTRAYTCCGRNVGLYGLNLGCKSCDHRPDIKNWSVKDHQRIPCIVIDEEEISVPEMAIVSKYVNETDRSKSYYVVSRFNLGEE